MSEKRFEWETYCKYDESLLKDNETNDFLSIQDCLNLLNELNDKNKQLRFLLDINALSERKKLEKENEQLRNIIKQKEEEEQLYAKEILRLNELNKQTSEFTDILGGY